MELEYHSLSITTVIFFIMISTIMFFLFLSMRKTSTNYNRVHQNLPPGPWKLPIIGNLHNLIGSLPHHSLRELSKEYGPIMHLQMGEVSTIIVSSPRMAREVLKTHDLSFAQRPQLEAAKIVAYDDMNIAFSPYGEYWKQMKTVLISELLTAKRVASFSLIREEEVFGLIESIHLSSAVETNSWPVINLSERLLKLMVGITCRVAFGAKCKDEAALTSLLKEAALLAGGFDLADLFPSKKLLQVMSLIRAKLKKIHEKSDKIIQDIINEHIQNQMAMESSSIEVEPGKEDFLDVLLKLQRSGRYKTSITTDHIKALICDVFAGGTHTASTTVEWAMAEMMKNPRVMEKAQAEVRRLLRGKKRIHQKDIFELSYLKAMIRETLRLHPPAPLLPRECREPCRINEYNILMKTKVIINAWAIGRDPEYWDEPDVFLPERFISSSLDCHKESYDFAYIPFGAGRRMCPGMSSGMANIELTLCHLLYHFNWELPPGTKPENFDMTEAFGASVGRKRNLCLTAIPFVPIDE